MVNAMSGLNTYETTVRRILSLISWQSVAPEQFELKDGPKGRRRRRCASRILDFELLRRKIASMKSMRCWRRARRASHIYLNPDSGGVCFLSPCPGGGK